MQKLLKYYSKKLSTLSDVDKANFVSVLYIYKRDAINNFYFNTYYSTFFKSAATYYAKINKRLF